MGSSLLGSLKQASPQVKQKSAKVVGWKMVSSGGCRSPRTIIYNTIAAIIYNVIVKQQQESKLFKIL